MSKESNDLGYRKLVGLQGDVPVYLSDRIHIDKYETQREHFITVYGYGQYGGNRAVSVSDDELRSIGSAINGRFNQPLLGLATTRELLTEIAVRGEMDHGYGILGAEMAIGARNLLEQLPGSMLDYRTVDHA